VIEYHLKNHKKWGARDRRFFAEAVYDIVRWWRLLWSALGAEPQLNEAALWKILGAWLVKQKEDLPAWDEFKDLSAPSLRAFLGRTDISRAICQSIPDWMDSAGEEQLGERWSRELPALNTVASVVLRANRLKIESSALQTQLQKEDVETVTREGFADALILTRRQNVFRTEAFKKGFFEIQDLASQAVAPFLNPQPGERVVDACAGAGGKTLHLAALMKNKGKIISMDVEGRKLEELRVRCRRAGVDIAETRVIESSKTIKRMESSADRLLLDVPCSGLGVLRRNPDAKWKLAPQSIDRIQGLQREILSAYPRIVRSGGIMVYSTCSLFPKENEIQVKWFLENNPGWQLEDEKHYWPSDDFDGFYMARLKKT
jgi:16S rRNA (cytosine967-C5)-methyltransferase